MSTGGITARNYEIRTDITLIAEEVLLEHRHAGDDAGLTAGRHGMEFEVGGDERSGEFRVCRCSSSSAPDLRCDSVQLLAVLIGDDRARCCSGISCYLCKTKWFSKRFLALHESRWYNALVQPSQLCKTYQGSMNIPQRRHQRGTQRSSYQCWWL